MVYSKVELKSNSDEVSSCVKTFLTGNVSDVDYLGTTIGFLFPPPAPQQDIIAILCIASEWNMRIG